MILVDELRGIIAKRGKSQVDVAKKLSIAPKTFYKKMKKGVFGSNEIEVMIKYLNIEHPLAVFFAPNGTLDVPESEQT